jgi:hypothetical protein
MPLPSALPGTISAYLTRIGRSLVRTLRHSSRAGPRNCNELCAKQSLDGSVKGGRLAKLHMKRELKPLR